MTDTAQRENKALDAKPASEGLGLTGTNSPPMAVLPLNSSSKLDQEPNPFEKSFSGMAATGEGGGSSGTNSKHESKENHPHPETPKPVLPPVASITSPALIGGGVLPRDVANQFAWDSLRSGPLSPSMLQGPKQQQNYQQSSPQQQQQQQYSVLGKGSSSQGEFVSQETVFASEMPYAVPASNGSGYARPQQEEETSDEKGSVASPPNNNNNNNKANTATRRKASVASKEDDKEASKKKQRTREKSTEDDEKRKNFLERNRIAALKCRQRKKQWLNNLQSKVEMLTSENEQLQVQTEAMREEIVNLKTLLLAHKDCPVAQSNGFTASAVQKSIPTVMPQHMMHPRTSAQPSQPPPPPTQAQQQQQPSAAPQPPVFSYARQGQPGDRPTATATPTSASSRPPTAGVTYTSGMSNPAFPVSNMIGVPMQEQGGPHHPHQQGMVAGSSGVMRF
ncbi:hypothetical protein BCR43DRAFT_494384 [Syncephalastrum racemosum]|uniref:BZIP domain-containing protein n=1 Tax=Syncephalastrum racemosum TaxID=13706 RepID=A0A1X2H7X2_SYNRA|nr:hypothetical protein BCR43DRAFT_494384 [Syncephalastrum racemosum]